jgi:hypothetical protein
VKVASIIVSALTTGMCSASISYDYDSDPENRAMLPTFYGYLPDEGTTRTIMYICMVLQSALLLLLRSFGAALLVLTDKKTFFAYMAGDQVLYLLQKLVRSDFLYWSKIEGKSRLLNALMMRVMVKTVTDFTGLIQCRGAGELGGIVWTANMLMALAAPWVAVPIYFERAKDAGGGGGGGEGDDADDAGWELKEAAAYRLLAGLSAGWICVFTLFLSQMKKGYVQRTRASEERPWGERRAG